MGPLVWMYSLGFLVCDGELQLLSVRLWSFLPRLDTFHSEREREDAHWAVPWRMTIGCSELLLFATFPPRKGTSRPAIGILWGGYRTPAVRFKAHAGSSLKKNLMVLCWFLTVDFDRTAIAWWTLYDFLIDLSSVLAENTGQSVIGF